jgi:uncharacterized protein (DUF2141 family)
MISMLKQWRNNYGFSLLTIAVVIYGSGMVGLFFWKKAFDAQAGNVPGVEFMRAVPLDMNRSPRPAVSMPDDYLNGEMASVTIQVDGFENDDGACLLAVYDTPDAFVNRNNEIAKEKVKITDRTAEWTVDLPIRTAMVIAVFHDENGNDQLDKGFRSIPTERYGFSRNARAIFGPPDFLAAKVEFNDQNPATLQITVK